VNISKDSESLFPANNDLTSLPIEQERHMLEAYRQHVAERAALGIPPLPLNAKQTEQLVELIKNPPKGEESTLVELIVCLRVWTMPRK
jgi:Aconitate B N-terminal domain